jgi:hypothetical protein
MNGELSHRFVTQVVHEEIPVSRGSAVGSRGSLTEDFLGFR